MTNEEAVENSQEEHDYAQHLSLIIEAIREMGVCKTKPKAKPKMAPEEVMRAFRDSARLTKTDANEEAGEIAYFMSDTLRAAVIDALLRQIPMKPDLLSDDGDEGEENLYGCPRCSNPYIDSQCCSVCGQALDWNKDENKKTVFCMDCRYWRKCDFRCDLYGIIVPGPWSCPDGRKGEKE